MMNTDMSTPPEEVDRMMQMMADEEQLDLSGQLSSEINKTPAKEDKIEDQLEARLAKLRS